MEKETAPGLKLFDNAHSYSEAAKLLCDKAGEKYSTENTYLNHSAAIYAGLAIEYYLKALYFVEYAKKFDEHGKTPHDFYTLYSSLKHKTRKNLEYQFFNLTSNRNMLRSPGILKKRSASGLNPSFTSAFIPHHRMLPTCSFFLKWKKFLREQYSIKNRNGRTAQLRPVFQHPANYEKPFQIGWALFGMDNLLLSTGSTICPFRFFYSGPRRSPAGAVLAPFRRIRGAGSSDQVLPQDSSPPSKPVGRIHAPFPRWKLRCESHSVGGFSGSSPGGPLKLKNPRRPKG